MLAAAAWVTVASADVGPTGGPRDVRGFVLSNVYLAAPPEEAGACPRLADGTLDIFLKSLPVAERKKYATPDKREELLKLMNQRMGFRFSPATPDPVTRQIGPEQIAEKRKELGIPDGKGGVAFLGRTVVYDSCTDPSDFPMFDAGHQPYLGKRAVGIDLDGKSGPDDFQGLRGETGVDNQLWRAIGCVTAFHESGKPEIASKVLFSARAPTLIELSGVDDPENDPEVHVSIYAGTNALTTDAAGHPLAKASFDINPDPRTQAHVRGRIEHGVLTTDAFDVQLAYREQIVDTVRKLRDVHLQATLNADGSIEGALYGYYNVDSFWTSIQQMSQLGAALSGVACPQIHTALERYADGFPDPKSGRNTAISSAMQFLGVRAHLVHGPAAASVAAASAP